MADYFENMCVAIPLKKGADKRKREWWDKVKGALYGPLDEGSPAQKFLDTLELPEEAQCCTICEIRIEDDAVCLIDDAGVVQSDGLVAILQAYLRKFEPKGVICVQIAFTCSKHRSDGFGGCAILVTADKAQYKTLSDVCEEMVVLMGIPIPKRLDVRS